MAEIQELPLPRTSLFRGNSRADYFGLLSGGATAKQQ